MRSLQRHIPRISRIPSSAVFPAVTRCLASSLVSKIDQSIEALPLREAVRYVEKNMKWTAEEFLNHSEAHANALLEYEFSAGDTIALWLPESAEKHVTMLAAAKAGIRVVDVDVNITDVASIREFLKSSKCKAIYFLPTYNNINYVNLLRRAIPEFYHYDNSAGQHFHSKHFPDLSFFIHLGFDNEFGCLTYSEIFLRHPPDSHVKKASQSLQDDTPVYTKISTGSSGSGIEVGSTLTHKQVLDAPAWSFANKLINKEYFEVN